MSSYQENMRALIAAKLKGQEVTVVAQPHLAPVVDLMEALKKSLAERQGVRTQQIAAVEKVAPPGPQAVPAPPKKVRKKLAS